MGGKKSSRIEVIAVPRRQHPIPWIVEVSDGVSIFDLPPPLCTAEGELPGDVASGETRRVGSAMPVPKIIEE